MVFRKSGKLKSRDKWLFKGENIEVVNEYKYKKNNFHNATIKKVREKVRFAKLAINYVWNTLISSCQMPLQAKYSCFNTIAKAIMCYAMQKWGHCES